MVSLLSSMAIHHARYEAYRQVAAMLCYGSCNGVARTRAKLKQLENSAQGLSLHRRSAIPPHRSMHVWRVSAKPPLTYSTREIGGASHSASHSQDGFTENTSPPGAI
jgi:hypothetical protein